MDRCEMVKTENYFLIHWGNGLFAITLATNLRDDMAVYRYWHEACIVNPSIAAYAITGVYYSRNGTYEVYVKDV